MLKTVTASLAALGLLVSSQAFAHAALKVSAPASGATVAAPHDLSLTFSEKVRLTAVRLTTGSEWWGAVALYASALLAAVLTPRST